jgi:5,5'-dehydrodivanillate O-demethylase
MLSAQDNETFTQVGPGTLGGDLQRRYWHPIAAAVDLDEKRVVQVRVLGENLVLYKAGNGTYGLVQERCPHRSAGLQYGWADEEGLRCSYHGWYFNNEGQCIAQPFDDTVGTGSFKARVKVTAYPVQKLGGLLWAYLGPEPAPLLPRWEILVREGVSHDIGFTLLPCNWLQIAENGLDPVHVEWLHVNQMNLAASRAGAEPIIQSFEHINIDFAAFEYGIYKRRLIAGDPEDSRDWTVGHPMLFPAILAQENMFQFRIPVDDTHTMHIVYSVTPPEKSGQTTDFVHEIPYQDEKGNFLRDLVIQQDFTAWISQGEITPRSEEVLSRSDRGVTMYRSMLRDALEALQRGEDPIGVVRDPAVNEPSIRLEFEGVSPHTSRVGVVGFASALPQPQSNRDQTDLVPSAGE